jgi:hypothetical protein
MKLTFFAILCFLIVLACAYTPFTKEQQINTCGVVGDCVNVETRSGKVLVTGLNLLTDTWREVLAKLKEPKPTSLTCRGALLHDEEVLAEYVTFLGMTLTAGYDSKEEL